MTDAKLGLFTTLTSTGSRQLVTTIAEACQTGAIPGARVAFLFVNRDAGESAVTDESIAAVAARFAFPIIRASAARYRRDERRWARELAAQGESEPLWAWREDYYASYRDRLLATDLDLLLGDMWIWSRTQCSERPGLNLHPALPTGPLGKMWYEVIWDLVAQGATHSGVMLHRVTPLVDRGPVATYCRYSLRGPDEKPLWASLPECAEERRALLNSQRLLKREATHPLFPALRRIGLRRELPLMLETARAVAEGRLRFVGPGVVGPDGLPLAHGLDLTAEVQRAVTGGAAVRLR